MSKVFNQIGLQKPRRNAFDLSHEKKLSGNMGKLIPIYLQEVIPGDSFRVNSELFIRLAPLTAPLMHRINVYTHYFFVPNRLVYDDWEDFITGGKLGTAAPAFPKITLNEAIKFFFASGQLADYMGVPVCDTTKTVTNSLDISALPFRAYQMIYNEYFRDQNLTDPVAFSTTGAVDSAAALLTIRNRAWERDYFTSALPFAQRGADVNLPLSNTVNYSDEALVGATGTALYANASSELATSAAGSTGISLENIETIDSVLTVNDLRRATKLQIWLEKNMRGGARYIEQIKSHFGIVSSDARLQRPEYLGGGKQPVVISEVLQTSSSDLTSPQGNMSGHGVSVGKTNGFQRSFEEHGYIIGIMSVLPRTAYQQGVNKTFLKFDKFDYFWPEFANLGEQEVINKELYHDFAGASGSSLGTFGYQSRYSEYKFNPDTVHGDFKNSFDHWHMGRIFSNKPELNETFVMSSPRHDVFAVTDADVHKLYVQCYHDVKAIRPMPEFGTPML